MFILTSLSNMDSLDVDYTGVRQRFGEIVEYGMRTLTDCDGEWPQEIQNQWRSKLASMEKTVMEEGVATATIKHQMIIIQNTDSLCTRDEKSDFVYE